MRLLVGLGNPGARYEQTRHNVGAEVALRVAARHGIAVKEKKFGALIGSGRLGAEQVAVALPQTFMNLSGDAVSPMVGFWKVSRPDIVVLHDELDLPFGDVRVKAGGGHGGHNGLRDLIAKLGGADFVRVRFGIGRPDDPRIDPADFVLAKFTPGERKSLAESLDRAADVVESVVRDGATDAMNRWNGAGKAREKNARTDAESVSKEK